MRMVRTAVDVEMRHLATAKRARRNHPLHSQFKNTLRETAFENPLRAGFLDAAGMTRVAVITFVVILVAGELHLAGIDDDYMVSTIEMGRVGRLVLAAQTVRNKGCETANDDAFGVDHDPLLLDLGGFRGIGLHGENPEHLQMAEAARCGPGSTLLLGRRRFPVNNIESDSVRKSA